ncbi:MAG: CHRD domain-containing protein [Dehalococcoidia bacterium]|nr:CHRD domain-containing protein [Dehalococcoidia bacterium]
MTRRVILLASVLVVLIAAVQLPAAEAAKRTFVAHLGGSSENPPNDSLGQGQAILHLSKDGDSLDYRLIVANIDGVTQAHIHCGGPDDNGPVVAFLFGPVTEGVTVNGTLATGTITNADVIPRPDSAACPGGVANFDEMVEKIIEGEAYVNVHTLALPAGEIRGQTH